MDQTGHLRKINVRPAEAGHIDSDVSPNACNLPFALYTEYAVKNALKNFTHLELMTVYGRRYDVSHMQMKCDPIKQIIHNP